MATGYLFNLPYHGHVNPTLALVEELTRRGERIVFYGLERFRSVAERAGAEFRPFDYEETRKGVALMVMAEWQMQVTEETIVRLISDAVQDRPSYVMVDYTCLWGRFFAQHLRLPTAVIHSTFPLARRFFPAARSTMNELLRSSSMWRSWFSYLRADRRLARALGVPRIGMPFNLVYADYGDLHLVLTSRDMAAEAHRFGSRYAFVGPCVRSRGCTNGQPLPPIDGRPLVYISLGTFWNNVPDFYRTCIDALASEPVQVLISAGEGMNPAALGELPQNVHVRAHVDQIEVLERASVFLTHGGMNSTCEGLLAGVPLLVFPQVLDQFAQADYVARSGAGLALRREDIRPGSLRDLVTRLLSDESIRIRSAQIARELRDAGGATRAADLIQALRPEPAAPADGAAGPAARRHFSISTSSMNTASSPLE